MSNAMLTKSPTEKNNLHNLFKFILSIIHFCCGLTEAIILSEFTDAKRDCGPGIWYCIMSCCIIHFFLFIIELIEAITDFRKFELADHLRYTLFLVRIWACVCMYDTSIECVAHFEDNYGRLWIMIRFEAIIFILFITLGVVAWFASCFIFPYLRSRGVSDPIDETAQPNKPITRAEFDVLIDKVGKLVALTEQIKHQLEESHYYQTTAMREVELGSNIRVEG
jgi:hypothetical protein